MAYTFANLKTDLRSYTEVDDTVLTDAICSTITKTQKIEFIERQIMMTIDFMLLLL